VSGDIFAGQPSDPDRLAELYDLEHDEVVEDLAFYREMSGRSRGRVLDLGCGSGRLLRPFLAGGATQVVGVDAAPALLRRAAGRIADTPELAAAADAGRLSVMEGDIRHLDVARTRRALGGRADLVVLAGVLPHLDGPEEALSLLSSVADLLAPTGTAVLDDLGPGLLPARDLPLSVDWRRTVDGREITRRSQLVVRAAPEGLRVLFSTLVDVGQPDGTIARLPASHRLWYPSHDALTAIVGDAGLAVVLAYGSHDLDELADDSDRRIFMVQRPSAGSEDPRGVTGRSR
jgi:SAM-dependent methyltransferase